MVEMPKEFLGRPVVRSVQHATDESEAPYFGTVVLDYGNGIQTVIDVFSHDGEVWGGQNGAHRILADSAERIFVDRCKRRTRFTHMVMEGKCTWLAVAMMRWDSIPVSGRDEFTVYARDAAGKARDFLEFYYPVNREVRNAIERWLIRYSEAHTHPDLRS
jgi:hypothetical protein